MRLIPRRFRRLPDPAPMTDLEHFQGQLRELAGVIGPDARAIALEFLAFWAEQLALTACLDQNVSAASQDETRKWITIREMCRALAATERGHVLADPRGLSPVLTGYARFWRMLAGAADADDRAGILRSMSRSGETAYLGSWAAKFLHDIADTELSAACSDPFRPAEPEEALQ